MTDSTAPRDGRNRHDEAASRGGDGSRGGGFFAWLKRLTGVSGESDLKETLEEILEEHSGVDQGLGPEQREMLLNIVSFGELQVDDVMVPRTDIVGVEVSMPLDEVVEAFRGARHSRLPVYRETLDDVIGFIHIKDIIDFWGDGGRFDLQQVLRQVLIVPPSMPVLDLLARMRTTRLHMAIVVDEYGGTDGLVTIEDAVEEIVGDIEDEHDVDEGPMLVERPDGSLDADGRCEIEEVESRLGVDLLPEEMDEEVDTLGGLVFTMLGRIPEVGEVVRHDVGLEIEITDADARRIKRLTLRRVPAAESREA